MPKTIMMEVCPGGECDKNPTGVEVTALDDFGRRVQRLLGGLTRVPQTQDPWVQMVIGEQPSPSAREGLHVLAGPLAQTVPDAICLVGTDAWLAAALAAIVKLTVEAGKICIDLSDLRTIFRGVGPVRGVCVTGSTLHAAAEGAVWDAGPGLGRVRSVLVHIDAPLSTNLHEIFLVAAMVQGEAHLEANVVFNFYANKVGCDDEELVRITLLIAGGTSDHQGLL